MDRVGTHSDGGSISANIQICHLSHDDHRLQSQLLFIVMLKDLSAEKLSLVSGQDLPSLCLFL